MQQFGLFPDEPRMNQPAISIQDTNLGTRVFIIAEIGVNHNGDPELARRMVRKAKSCGADCVKFQTFKAERVAAASAPKARYQVATTTVPPDAFLATISC
jgi:N-acetylneuraminate synthase/N,N'-diacetyllegionaminate synthase